MGKVQKVREKWNWILREKSKLELYNGITFKRCQSVQIVPVIHAMKSVI